MLLQLFTSDRCINTVFENLRGTFPTDWKTNAAGIRSNSSANIRVPSFLEYGEYPYVTADEIKKALKVKERFVEQCSIRCNKGNMRLAWQGKRMLEFDDIQYLVLTRVPAITGRYEFLSFRQASQGRAWLAGLIDKVASALARSASTGTERRGGFPSHLPGRDCARSGWTRPLLPPFPRNFGKAWRLAAEILGDTGRNHPDNWIGGLASPDLHAIAILFARDPAERQRVTSEHQAYLASTPGVEVLSTLDLDAIPPFDAVREHFGYRDRLTEPPIEGTGTEPTPGSGPPIKPGEFILGYPDEDGPPAGLPQPEVLSRNGSLYGLPPLTTARRRIPRVFASTWGDAEQSRNGLPRN